MSYGNTTQTPRPRGNCSCFLFLIIVAVAAYFLFGQGVQIQPGGIPNGPGEIDRSDPLEPLPRLDNVERAPAQHPDSNDWKMEKVESKRTPENNSTNPKQRANATPDSKKSSDGDWTIEEVETKDKKAKLKNQFDISNRNKDPSPDSKSTKKGDWEIEEVDKSKK